MKKNRVKIGIRAKLTAIILFSTLITLSLGLLIAYIFGFQRIRETVGQERVQICDMLGQYIITNFRADVEDIETDATRPLWRDITEEANASYAGMKSEDILMRMEETDKAWSKTESDNAIIKKYTENRIAVSMREILKIRKVPAEIFLTDMHGGLVAASNKTSDFYQADEEWWKEAFNNGKGAISVSDVGFDESTQQFVIRVAMPVRGRDNEVIGVCSEGISVEKLLSHLKDFNIGETGHAAVVDQKGAIIFHSGIPIGKAYAFTEHIFKKITGTKKHYAVIAPSNVHKNNIFLSISEIKLPFLSEKGIRWYILLVQDASETFMSINKFTFQIAVTVLILLFIMTPIAFLLGGIFSKPIDKLRLATECMTGGGFCRRAEEMHTGDEIEELCRAFNAMIDNVNSNQLTILESKKELEALYANLEKKVEERTRELSESQEATLNILEDLTESKEKLDVYTKELEKALAVKSNFTSMVSHELRTPLSAIKEGIAIVQDGSAGNINKEQKEFLDIAKRNVDRLTRLISDILDFQKLESGKMPFAIKENDMNEAAQDVASTMTPLAESKGLKLTLSLEKNLPLICFDKDKIEQVLTNLLDNAIKATENGGIDISTAKDNNVIKVSVRDSGRGIKEEDINRLFQRFEQLDSGTSRKTGGTGLGLAICKEIIFAHNGKIWAESQYGKGSVFHFILPIRERRCARV